MGVTAHTTATVANLNLQIRIYTHMKFTVLNGPKSWNILC